MTATAAINGAWVPSGAVSPIPPIESAPLAASAQAGRGQILTFDSSGNVALNDGATPNVLSAGVAYPTALSATSTTAGAAAIGLDVGVGEVPMSTASLDSFGATDVLKPAYVYSENAIGKKTNTAGVKRALFGLVFGITNANETTPRALAWGGRIGQLLARALVWLDTAPIARYQIADASASTATAERAIPCTALVGLVTAVDFVGAAIAADNTDYVTITIKKYGAADSYASGTSIATYDSRAANQGAITAFTPAAFALSAVSGATTLLDTDVLTLTVAKAGAGKTLTGAIRVNGKVI